MQQDDQTSQISFSHQLGFGGLGEQKKIERDPAEMKRRKGEWCVDELKDNNNEYDPDFIYVKLAENRESYTAYNGSNVWQAIYEKLHARQNTILRKQPS